ncbi:MAG: exodeoxyribonuclease [Chloroflexota bacterium]|nr:exodeoxyribonuclease [Chloroflexota bacterium]
MKITTWNVNGIRAAMGKNILDWVDSYQPDVLCLQEIKAKEDQIEVEAIQEIGYQAVINPAERPGYSGTATLYRQTPPENIKGLGKDIFDNEGRVIRSLFDDFELFNIYFPNGGRDNNRVPYKLDFYAYLLDMCDEKQANGREIIITGDFNTAHNEIDLKNPKSNEKNTGFLPEERVWIDKYLEHGFIDAYRKLYPEEEKYTWWTYRFSARQKDIGWRLDYFLVTPGIMERTKDVVIHSEVMGSDHCPVTIILE